MTTTHPNAQKIKDSMAARTAAPAAQPQSEAPLFSLNDLLEMPREKVKSLYKSERIPDALFDQYCDALTAPVPTEASKPTRKALSFGHANGGQIKGFGLGTTFPGLYVRQLAALVAHPAAALAALPHPDKLMSEQRDNTRTGESERVWIVPAHTLGKMTAQVDIGKDTHAEGYRADYAALVAIVEAMKPRE